jgi:hypothetical protein
MTRLIHDRFAKDYLSEILAPLGIVSPGREVSSEVRQIDVYFTPNSPSPDDLAKLGVLGQMATTPALFEPFRNPAGVSEILGCLSKLLEVRAELERQSRRDNIRERELPYLWVLTPTASEALLNGFHALADRENWERGIYHCGEHFRMAIVAIHQLPETPQTLWLRILGRGSTQQRAIAALNALPEDDPLRSVTIELVYQLQSSLTGNREQDLGLEDRELIMAIVPLFQERLAAVREEGREEGLEQGREQGLEQGLERGLEQGREQGLEQGLEQGREQGLEQGLEQGRIQGQRLILESFLQVRLGELDPIFPVLITPISAVQAVDFSRLLVQLSVLPVDEMALQQAKQLLMNAVLRMRFPQWDDRLNSLIPQLLMFSPEQLAVLFSQFSQLPELSVEDLCDRLGNGV